MFRSGWWALIGSVALSGCPAPDVEADVDAGCGLTPFCQQNTLVTCGPDGGVLEVPCGEARCAVDAPTRQCVPADALPCTPEDFADRCLNGRLVSCPASRLYALTTSCGPDHLCVGSRCQPAEGLLCEQGAWSPLCVDGQLFVCNRGRMEVAPEPCEG